MLANRVVFEFCGLVADDGEAEFTTNMDGIAPTPKAIPSKAPNFVIPGRSFVCMFVLIACVPVGA